MTFINSIPARTDLLGVTLATDVTLAVPSGRHEIAPGGSWSEVFHSSCLTCTVTYKYRVIVGILPPLVPLPTLPASLPLVVNTIVPSPNVAPPPVNIRACLRRPFRFPSARPASGAGSGGVPGTPGAVPTTPGAPTVGGTPTGGTNNTGTTVGEQIMPSAGGPLILGAPNGFAERGRTSSARANGLLGGLRHGHRDL